MGCSGAGKSTFCNALLGRVDGAVVSGDVRVNDVPCTFDAFRGVTGFVPQDDVMLTELTVRENVTFAAHLKLPVGLGAESKLSKVDELLHELDILEIADQVVGSAESGDAGHISGGQRKRVSIALEMVADPVVLFLDEPTSGTRPHRSKSPRCFGVLRPRA